MVQKKTGMTFDIEGIAKCVGASVCHHTQMNSEHGLQLSHYLC